MLRFAPIGAFFAISIFDLCYDLSRRIGTGRVDHETELLHEWGIALRDGNTGRRQPKHMRNML
ncbi:hypothetical protein FHX76_000547 [Lysinibacter cavernae]|uniref:Uncharacterized protein n=1 Tax=Lysinibacter cavernae TaxID=1640652 RepID=A0A7X5QZ53_9MICO|nr:hypothetical protein [Lysinibacter cavernae]